MKLRDIHRAAIRVGPGPIIASAIHDGAAIRDEVQAVMALGADARRREEDPFTGIWTGVVPTSIVGLRSRFEVDLNRPRDQAVYLRPEQAWGLDIWKRPPPADLIARSLARYDAFYDRVGQLLDEKARQHGRFVLFDLHSYNHRRDGPAAPTADPADNPEINLGTGTLGQLAGDHALTDWSAAGLIKPSWVRLAKVFFALKSEVGTKYGRLSDSDRALIAQSWASLYGTFAS